MASMMGRFANSIIPAPHLENLTRPDQTQRPRQLFDPYPGQDCRSNQNSGVGRYGVKSQVPRGMWPARTLREGMPPEDRGPFKLPRAGTIERIPRRFRPGRLKKPTVER